MTTQTTIIVNSRAYLDACSQGLSEDDARLFAATCRAKLIGLSSEAEAAGFVFGVDDLRPGPVPYRIIEGSDDPGGATRALQFMQTHMESLRGVAAAVSQY